jgi:CheY-like chemotaxis protein
MSSPRKPVILCVDDEENPLLLRKFVLQKAGYEVLTAQSGKEALVVVESRDLDLVLTDYLMPNMSGAELAAQVKSQKPELPVVLLSGVNEIPTGSYIADGFLSKIEGPGALCEQLAGFLGDKQRQHRSGNDGQN